MNNKAKKTLRILLIFILSIIILNNNVVSSASTKNNINITNSVYNKTTSCWDFTLKLTKNSKIYYSFNDDEILNSKCKSIVSGQVISVPSSLINGSLKNLRLFTINKKNNITNTTCYRVDLIARNKYIEDLTTTCTSIYNNDDTEYRKARKLYTWIGENKLYKYDSDTNHEYGAFYGDSSACRGFARLYVDMCTIARIKCVYINDETADYNYIKWHAWNHLYLDNKLYLVDPTWSGVSFENEVNYSHFCNNSIVNHVITLNYDFSSSKYDFYNNIE